MMMAGATAVQIGTAIYYRGVDVFKKIVDEAQEWLEENNYVKGVWKYEEGKPGRKEYELTDDGLELLKIARERLTELSANLMEK